MTPYGFLAWAATQGIKHIPKKFLLQAFNSFKGKLPSNQVILKTAKNLYDDLIKKTPTKNIADKIRQDMKVKPIKVPEQTKNILNIKSTLEGRPVKVVPERPFTGFVPKVVKPKLQLKILLNKFVKKLKKINLLFLKNLINLSLQLLNLLMSLNKQKIYLILNLL